MSNSKRRVEKLETALTSKQAMLLRLQDAHSYNSVNEHVASMKTPPRKGLAAGSAARPGGIRSQAVTQGTARRDS